MDTAIIAHPTTWQASGHLASFSDALIDDKKTGKRFRADKIIEDFLGKELKKLQEIEDRFSLYGKLIKNFDNQIFLSSRGNEKLVKDSLQLDEKKLYEILKNNFYDEEEMNASGVPVEALARDIIIHDLCKDQNLKNQLVDILLKPMF
jgi:glycine--tRNA ligase